MLAFCCSKMNRKKRKRLSRDTSDDTEDCFVVSYTNTVSDAFHFIFAKLPKEPNS